MRKQWYSYFGCLLILWLLSGSSTVYADDPTETPEPTMTSTWRPLFEQPTIQPEQDYQCPEGMPEGYLTVTPSAIWNLYCGACLVEPYPTSTPWPLATWQPTYTPVPTEEPQGRPEEAAVFHVTDTYYEISNPSCASWGSVSLTDGYDEDPHRWLWNYQGQGYCSYWDTTLNVTIKGYADGGAPLYVYVSGTPLSYTQQVRTRDGGSTGNPSIYSSMNTLIEIEDSGNSTVPALIRFQIVVPDDVNLSNVLGYALLTIDTYDFTQNPEPEPTTTPVPENYCTSIEGATSEGYSISDYFPVPYITEPTCTGWAEWSAGEILGIQITIPGIEICFTPIHFGEITIMDTSVDMDYMIYVMGFVALLRMFLRS